MKRLLFFVVLAHQIGYAQITLEETYSNAGFNGGAMSWQTLELVRLEVDGDKFLFRDNENKELKFYNLDHTPWKTISYSAATDVQPDYNNAGILYVSQHLFDLDDEIEFMYTDVFQNSGVTQIVNEDGSFLFTANDQAPRLLASVPQNQHPIYSTDSGTFMILSGTDGADGDAYVYSLPGTLAVGIQEQVNEFSFNSSSLNVYPNPSGNEFSLAYEVPYGSMVSMRLTDELGRLVKTENLAGNNGTHAFNTSGLTPGVYFCSLVSNGEVLLTERLVVSE